MTAATGDDRARAALNPIRSSYAAVNGSHTGGCSGASFQQHRPRAFSLSAGGASNVPHGVASVVASVGSAVIHFSA